jgi:hypothetical protein
LGRRVERADGDQDEGQAAKNGQHRCLQFIA